MLFKPSKIKAAAVLFTVAALLLLSGGCAKSVKHTKQLFAMDTYITMTAYGSSDAALLRAADRITDIEKHLSSTVAGSDVSLINKAGGNQVALSDDARCCIAASLDIFRKSDGALDITIYPLVKKWGFISKNYCVPSDDEIAQLLTLVDGSEIRLDKTAASIPSGTEIDLGCIAKGYAAMCAAQLLKESGATGAVLSLGGNVQTIGAKPDGEKWNISIVDPFNHESGIIGTLSVGEAAAVTSGGYQRNFTSGGNTYHHILDPSTGRPAQSGLSSVTVVCHDGTYADGLSTALFVMGLNRALEYRSEYGGFEAVFVTDDKKIIVTDGLKNSFEPACDYPVEYR